VLTKKVWRRLLAVEADTVIERVDFDECQRSSISLAGRSRNSLVSGRDEGPPVGLFDVEHFARHRDERG
jgi:hypothetical protein